MNENTIRVLIVEDEEALLFGLKKLLQNSRTLIDTASSLADAEVLLHQNRYQAVLTDLRLSDTDIIEGYLVVKAVRALQPGCKIVVMTAFAEKGLKYHAAEGAVDFFLSKPIEPVRIREILNAL